MVTQSRTDSIDEMIDDSFPASDPPSFTPVPGTGARNSGSGSDAHYRAGVAQRGPEFALWFALAGAGAAVIGMVIRRKKRARRGTFARAVEPIREFVQRAVAS